MPSETRRDWPSTRPPGSERGGDRHCTGHHPGIRTENSSFANSTDEEYIERRSRPPIDKEIEELLVRAALGVDAGRSSDHKGERGLGQLILNLIHGSGRLCAARDGDHAGGHAGGGRIGGKRMNDDGAGGYACTVPDLDVS
jgi:hypothetical protein